jgi:hypothetical protein
MTGPAPPRSDWDAAADPDALLRVIWPEFPAYPFGRPAEAAMRIVSPRAPRRFRLFAVACARMVWDLLPADARSAVLAAERFADGRAGEADLRAAAVPVRYAALTAAQHAAAAAGNASAARHPGLPDEVRWHPGEAARSAAKALATRAAGPAPRGRPTPDAWHAAWTRTYNAARAAQAEFLRDIFPPPGYVPAVRPDWLTPTVVALAREVDASGDFSAVPVLADALQDAGCDDEVLLGRCRVPGPGGGGALPPCNPHVRGNWVVDAVLGR